MKNSLFKRAIAVAAAAPLALTQCLTVANAASVNNAGIAAVENETVAESEKSIKLNGEGGLLYIAPGKDATEKDYYMVGNEALAGLELTGALSQRIPHGMTLLLVSLQLRAAQQVL